MLWAAIGGARVDAASGPGAPPETVLAKCFGVRGVGVDLVSVDRVAAMVRRHPRALERLFVSEELADLGFGTHREEHLAVRFAVKEAAYKALGGTGTLPWRDIRYVRPHGDVGSVRLSGRALEMARQRGVERMLASVSHERSMAVATVVAVGRCASCGC